MQLVNLVDKEVLVMYVVIKGKKNLQQVVDLNKEIHVSYEEKNFVVRKGKGISNKWYVTPDYTFDEEEEHDKYTLVEFEDFGEMMTYIKERARGRERVA